MAKTKSTNTSFIRIRLDDKYNKNYITHRITIVRLILCQNWKKESHNFLKSECIIDELSENKEFLRDRIQRIENGHPGQRARKSIFL